MRYTKLPKKESAKAEPKIGSMFITHAEDGLAIVTNIATSMYTEIDAHVSYVVFATGKHSTMPLSTWRSRVHVEQAENLIVREV